MLPTFSRSWSASESGRVLPSWHTFGTHDLATILATVGGVRSLHRDHGGVLTQRAQSEHKYRMNTSPARTNQTAATPRIQMLTMQEAAERLGVSLQPACEMARCGLLPVARMGRQIRVEETRLMSWIESGGQCSFGVDCSS